MCIKYHIEFWTPVANDQPDWERRVKRGLVQPGQNVNARIVPFWECRGRSSHHAIPGVQAEATSRWRRAYDEWMSAYEHHRDCPGRRSMSQLFRDLKTAGVVHDKPCMGDAARLGIHPRSAPEPDVGMNRQYESSGRRY